MSKYMEEIDEIDNRSSHGDAVPTKKKSTRRILKSALILVLSVLCVTGGVLIHKINHKQLPSFTPTPLNQMLSQKLTGKTTVKPALADPAPRRYRGRPSQPAAPVQTPPQPVTTVADISQETLQQALESQENQELMPTAATPQVKVPRVQEYTMAQALLFKEHFLTGLSCQNDYETLQKVKEKTPLMREVLNGLAPYCRHELPALDNVKSAFLNNKRKALVMMYQEKSPHWLSYLKSILVYLIEIRKLNPETMRPKDILYKAQNEIYHNNIVKATLLLKQLPPQMQASMPDFFRESEIYLRADKSLNELILSFEKGEE